MTCCAFGQALQHFGLRAVADAGGDGHLAEALFVGRIGHLHRGRLVLVVDDRAFRNRQHPLVLFQNDLRVGRHLRLQHVLLIRDRNAHFERGDVVFLGAHGRDLGHVARELLVLERLHGDARRLAQIDLADIALVHLALHVDLDSDRRAS